jgi:hypothetical protein
MTIDLWSRMESPCMKNSLTIQIYLKRQLYSLKIREGIEIVDNLNVFNDLIF